MLAGPPVWVDSVRSRRRRAGFLFACPKTAAPPTRDGTQQGVLARGEWTMIETSITELIVPAGIFSTVTLAAIRLLWHARRGLYFRLVYDGKVQVTIRFKSEKPRSPSE